MATYETKFGLRETAYLVDATLLNLVPVVVTDIYIHASAAVMESTTVVPTYRVRSTNEGTGKTIYDETELYYIEEGRLEVQSLLAARNTDIENLR